MQTIDSWRAVRVRARVMERWHFMARRAAHVIARAGKQTGACDIAVIDKDGRSRVRAGFSRAGTDRSDSL